MCSMSISCVAAMQSFFACLRYHKFAMSLWSRVACVAVQMTDSITTHVKPTFTVVDSGQISFGHTLPRVSRARAVAVWHFFDFECVPQLCIVCESLTDSSHSIWCNCTLSTLYDQPFANHAVRRYKLHQKKPSVGSQTVAGEQPPSPHQHSNIYHKHTQLTI